MALADLKKADPGKYHRFIKHMRTANPEWYTKHVPEDDKKQVGEPDTTPLEYLQEHGETVAPILGAVGGGILGGPPGAAIGAGLGAAAAGGGPADIALEAGTQALGGPALKLAGKAVGKAAAPLGKLGERVLRTIPGSRGIMQQADVGVARQAMGELAEAAGEEGAELGAKHVQRLASKWPARPAGGPDIRGVASVEKLASKLLDPRLEVSDIAARAVRANPETLAKVMKTAMSVDAPAAETLRQNIVQKILLDVGEKSDDITAIARKLTKKRNLLKAVAPQYGSSNRAINTMTRAMKNIQDYAARIKSTDPGMFDRLVLLGTAGGAGFAAQPEHLDVTTVGALGGAAIVASAIKSGRTGMLKTLTLAAGKNPKLKDAAIRSLISAATPVDGDLEQ